MSNQRIFEVVKAIAYGETAEQAAEAEGMNVADVQQIISEHAADIAEERETLRKAGYIK